MESRAEFFVGQSASLTRTVTAEEVETFARATGDNNPVHLDEGYASRTRFGHRIAHGMLIASYISALLGSKFPGPGTIYMSQALKFLRPVFLGDEVTVTVTVSAYRPERAILTLDAAVRNKRGELVLAGEAVCLVEDIVASAARVSGAAAG
jgi:3-hydroxybutyryl-CoA dehydratase